MIEIKANHRFAAVLSVLIGVIALFVASCFSGLESADVLTALGIVAAISTAIYQLGAQREAEANARRIDLQISLYEKITRQIPEASPTGVSTSLQILLGELEAAERRENNGNTYNPPVTKSEDIHNLYTEVHSRLSSVTSDFERYEITSQNFPLFREALFLKIRQMNDAYLNLVHLLPYFVLSRNMGVEPNQLQRISTPLGQEFSSRVQQFSELTYDVSGFLLDMKIELQNIFLKDIFERTLPRRVPSDNRCIVLTSENEKELQKVRDYVESLRIETGNTETAN